MRKLYLLLIVLLLNITFALADHISGGELRYEYAGGSNYRIELALYAQCTGTVLPGTVSTLVSSANCSISQSLTLSLYQIDTLRDILCSSAVGVCSGTGTPLYLVHHYRNTISLACPNTDWIISYSSCCRNLGIQNIDLMTSSSFYLEAGLNNSTAPNSSAFIDNPPPFVTGAGTMISTPMHTTDPEGDSIVHSIRTPATSRLVIATYNSGFSSSNPFGTGVPVTISTSPEVMKTYANSGRFALAIRTDDYRNGVRVGYTTRDWDHRAGATSNPKAPLPTPTTSFNANICPGGTTTINLSFKDSVGTDSVFAFIAGQPGFPGFTTSTVSTPGIGTGSVSYTLTAPSSLSAALNPYFIIPVFVRDNACPIRGYAIYNIVLRVAPCVPDTVWAGDANGDKVVNMYDPLAISIAYGRSGPLRPSASIAWTPQPCGNWSNSFLSGVNMKHADCNGDGTVNNSDLAAVTANYGQFHAREIYLPHAKVAGIPDLYFDHTGVSVYPGATVNIPVKLGSPVSTFGNMYGIAAGLRINGITPVFGTPVSYGTSWLGTAANTVQFSKTTTANNVDWAYARNNRQTVSGNGTLATFSFTIPAGTSVGDKIILTFNNVKVIDAAGNELSNYNILSDTITVRPAGIEHTGSQVSDAVILPNPSNGLAALKFNLHQAADLNVTVADITGRILWHHGAHFAAGATGITLPVTDIPAGVYLIRILANDALPTKGLKWIKD